MERGSTPVISALKCTDGELRSLVSSRNCENGRCAFSPPPSSSSSSSSAPILPWSPHHRRPTPPRQPRSRTAICIIFTLASPRLRLRRALLPPSFPPPSPLPARRSAGRVNFANFGRMHANARDAHRGSRSRGLRLCR